MAVKPIGTASTRPSSHRFGQHFALQTNMRLFISIYLHSFCAQPRLDSLQKQTPTYMQKMTSLWQAREIDNYTYLMHLNSVAGSRLPRLCVDQHASYTHKRVRVTSTHSPERATVSALLQIALSTI